MKEELARIAEVMENGLTDQAYYMGIVQNKWGITFSSNLFLNIESEKYRVHTLAGSKNFDLFLFAIRNGDRMLSVSEYLKVLSLHNFLTTPDPFQFNYILKNSWKQFALMSMKEILDYEAFVPELNRDMSDVYLNPYKKAILKTAPSIDFITSD